MTWPEDDPQRPIPQDAIDPQRALEVFYGEDRRLCGDVPNDGAPPVADAAGSRGCPHGAGPSRGPLDVAPPRVLIRCPHGDAQTGRSLTSAGRLPVVPTPGSTQGPAPASRSAPACGLACLAWPYRNNAINILLIAQEPTGDLSSQGRLCKPLRAALHRENWGGRTRIPMRRRGDERSSALRQRFPTDVRPSAFAAAYPRH